MKRWSLSIGLSLLSTACLSPAPSTGTMMMMPPGNNNNPPPSTSVDPSAADNVDAIAYRDLGTHPGCTTDGLTYTAAQIPGYRCAAKEYALSVPEDTSKPIVLLIHGNSSTPADWEKFPADSSMPMLSERLVAAGFKTYAIDMRIDKTDDPTTNDPKTGNPAHNIDHGWGEPIVAHFIQSVLDANPKRQISLVGFSYAPTVIRDSLRRLHRAGSKPFERVRAVVLASGANHGVSSFRSKCSDPQNPANVTMAGRVACEMGDRTAYVPTAFLTPLNGTDGAWETPCADGNNAYGQSGVCGDHAVQYTTVVMRDPPQGALQDEFVSEKSSRLEGADNKTVELADQDQTGYFYNGHFKNHFGSIRSEAGLTIIMNALSR